MANFSFLPLLSGWTRNTPFSDVFHRECAWSNGWASWRLIAEIDQWMKWKSSRLIPWRKHPCLDKTWISSPFLDPIHFPFVVTSIRYVKHGWPCFHIHSSHVAFLKNIVRYSFNRRLHTSSGEFPCNLSPDSKNVVPSLDFTAYLQLPETIWVSSLVNQTSAAAPNLLSAGERLLPRLFVSDYSICRRSNCGRIRRTMATIRFCHRRASAYRHEAFEWLW